MSEQLTSGARGVMQIANNIAHEMNHEYMGSEHIVWALIQNRQSVSCGLLERLNIDPNKIDQQLKDACKPSAEATRLEQCHKTPRTKIILGHASRVAEALGDEQVGELHLLVAVLWEYEQHKAEGGIGGKVLYEAGATTEKVLALMRGVQVHGIPANLVPMLDELVTRLGCASGDYITTLKKVHILIDAAEAFRETIQRGLRATP